MIFNHIRIDAQRLQEVVSRAETVSSTNGSGRRSSPAGGGTVSEAVIVATRDAQCRCEDPEHMATIARHVGGTYLHAGMRIVATREEPGLVPGGFVGNSLGGGCTHPRYVCPRLIKVRSRYGY